MLKIVRKTVWFALFIALAAAVTAFAGAGRPIDWLKPLEESSSTQGSAASSPSLPKTPQQLAAPSSAPRTLQTVVLDPAHGGTDEGAHGAGGILEKDVVLTLAQAVQARLEQMGLRVVMTRNTDTTLSFEQRAAIANAQPDAVFITLHVGSSGPVGSANTYYYNFGQIIENQSGAATAGLVDWNRAQIGWQGLSQRLAQLLQVEFSERLRSSPELPTGAAVYQLREIDEPAVAIEIENINAPSVETLNQLGTPLAQAISRAVAAFRVVYQTGAP
ncbi:MAG TPA: N-acetylmuramoyl-L-alanine amidase [Candidatus Dormibacteraeota bacterium]|nr:N-acetylmuramoyl-L-alanine amidase [Candidatus Dormibacteraeota bacterium]